MKRFLFLIGLVAMSLYFVSCSKDEPCDDVSCQNGGACVDGNCNCPVLFSGSLCENQVRNKYPGSYEGWGEDDFFIVKTFKDTVVLEKQSADPSLLRIHYNGFYSNDEYFNLKLLNANDFNIPKQTDSDNNKIWGNGKMVGNTISMEYFIESDFSGTPVLIEGSFEGELLK